MVAGDFFAFPRTCYKLLVTDKTGEFAPPKYGLWIITFTTPSNLKILHSTPPLGDVRWPRKQSFISTTAFYSLISVPRSGLWKCCSGTISGIPLVIHVDNDSSGARSDQRVTSWLSPALLSLVLVPDSFGLYMYPALSLYPLEIKTLISSYLLISVLADENSALV